MTYCVAARLNAGLVFLSDSRTNAGVDQVGTFRKLHVLERPGDRVIMLMTSGNLAVSQAVLNILAQHDERGQDSIWQAANMHEAAVRVGEAIRKVHERDGQALLQQGVEFNVSMIVGGQIKGECCRLFQLYSAGNFIEAHEDCAYFQIGEFKYGKPIMDRVVTADSSLNETAKCALISMDSTLRSNISVGLPLDLLVYEADSLRVTHFTKIDENNTYFQMIRSSWGERLRQVFMGIPDPVWGNPGDKSDVGFAGRICQPLRVAPSGEYADDFSAPQVLAQNIRKDQQD